MTYDTAAIRRFLMGFFNDEEIANLSFDYFPEVYENFAAGMSKGRMVRDLITYCRARNRLPDLLAALERERPEAFKEFFAANSHIELPATSPLSTPVVRNPRQVLVSHARPDTALARRLTNDLLARGWQVWIAPDSIRPGEKWVESINRGLEESGVFVLLLSSAAVASPWVQLEANAAIQLEREGNLRFIPLLVESCDPPLLWRAYQWIPLQDNYESGFKALLAELTQRRHDAVIWPGDGKEMVRVPQGEFFFGYGKQKLSLPEFWIDKLPVTNGEYARFVMATAHKPPSHWRGQSPAPDIVDHPVVNVSWYDAAAYAKWAGKQLPTVEEWEKAARGTTGRDFPWGNQRPSAELCNCDLNIGRTTPVGLYSTQGDSPYGCVDMVGNVWEWTDTWFDDSKKYRVLCGGSWSLHRSHVHVSVRHRNLPYFTYINIGFRLVSRSLIDVI